MNDVKTIIIPAAGAGTRLRPISSIVPKEMLRLVDRPIFYYLIKEAYQAGISRAIFVIHQDKLLLKDTIKKDFKINLHSEFPNFEVSFIETKDRLGDGHALFLAKNFIKKGERFAVTMADLFSAPGKSILEELVLVSNKTKTPVISIEEVLRSNVPNYGVIDPVTVPNKANRLYKIKGIIEKPKPKDAPSNFAMTGKYILTPEIFYYLGKLLAKNKNRTEVKLADALNDFSKENDLNAYLTKSKHYDTGNKLAILKTELELSLLRPDLRGEVRKMIKSLKI